MTTVDGNIIVNKDNILKELKDASVLSIELETPDEVNFVEPCDNFYWATLSKEELGVFIQVMQEIYNQMK